MPEQRRIGYQLNFCPWPTATSERENSTLGISLHFAEHGAAALRDATRDEL